MNELFTILPGNMIIPTIAGHEFLEKYGTIQFNIAKKAFEMDQIHDTDLIESYETLFEHDDIPEQCNCHDDLLLDYVIEAVDAAKDSGLPVRYKDIWNYVRDQLKEDGFWKEEVEL